MKARTWRAVIVGIFATIVLALGATAAAALPASASTAAVSSKAKIATQATPLQNKVLDAALANTPGGTRISADEASWDEGHLILGVASSSSFVTPTGYLGSMVENNEKTSPLICTGGYFCAYGATELGGTCWMYLESGTLDEYAIEFDWAAFSGTYCGSVGTWSWINDSGDRVWKEQYFSDGLSLGDDFYQLGTPSGTTYCIDPSGGNSTEYDVTSESVRTLGWIYMSDNTSNC